MNCPICTNPIPSGYIITCPKCWWKIPAGDRVWLNQQHRAKNTAGIASKLAAVKRKLEAKNKIS